MNLRRINLGVIGCGYIAKTAHLPNLMKIPEVRVICASDTENSRLNEVRQTFGITDLYTDYKELLARKDLEAVVVCTPTATHSPITIEAAEAGLSVFCEKPMALSVKEADDMIAAVERNHVRLMIGHFLRFLPNHQYAFDLLQKGKIGKPFYLEATSEAIGPFDHPATHFYFSKREGGGALLDLGVHLIDLLLWLSNQAKVKEVSASFNSFMPNIQVETQASLTLNFASGFIGHISLFWLPWRNYEAVRRFVRILGTEGKIISDLTGPSLTLYREGTLVSKLLGEQRIIPGRVNPKAPSSDIGFRGELEEFAKSVQADRPPSVGGKDGRATLEIVELARMGHSYRSITEAIMA